MWNPFIDFFLGIVIHKHISTSQNKKVKKKENNPLVEYLVAFIRRRAPIWRVWFITWLSCLSALLAYVPTCLTWLRDYMTNLDTCLCALRAYVSLNFMCLSALNDFTPTCTRPLGFYVSMCLNALNYVPTFPLFPLFPPSVYVPKYLNALNQ